ncbi:peroxide stress protein YaaA [Streptococcus suis]|uniref:peroxide stress protein YaaA n=1 Tax=Streptococcus suis TaxID=1307 RepID=UPI001ABEBF53|nr:peroxide stress protein YaaA [Streptococcus suis]
MKILLPNAKELNTNLDNHPFQSLSSASQQVATQLSQLSLAELARFYKLNEERAQLEADRWQRILQGQAKSYPAFQLYDGLMYRYMKRRDLSAEEEHYLDKHVLIATGLYGLISPFDLISPHRLDFQGSVKIGSRSLKQFWRQAYDRQLEGEDLVISLLSSEFEQVFSPALQKKMVRIQFAEILNGKKRVHSTISKKARGRMVSLLAEKQIQDLEQVLHLEVDGFSYQEDQSDKFNILFAKIISK